MRYPRRASSSIDDPPTGAVVASAEVTLRRGRHVRLVLRQAPPGWVLRTWDEPRCRPVGSPGAGDADDGRATELVATEFVAAGAKQLERYVTAGLGRRVWHELLDECFDPALYEAWQETLLERGLELEDGAVLH